MGEEINIIIDNLCDKLGTTANVLIPELAKLRITETTIALIIALIILIIGLVTLPKAWRYDHRENERYLEDSLYTLIPVTLIIIGFIISAFRAVALAGWIASPTAKAILEIVGMLR